MVLKGVAYLIFIHAILIVIAEVTTQSDKNGSSNSVKLSFGNSPMTAKTNIRIVPQTCSNHSSGIQPVQPQFGYNEPFLVVCDQDYSGGGWTIIQNRFNGAVNFYRGWKAYEDGFGDLFGEYWLGLKKIHELTYARHHELRIVLEDFDGNTVWARYSDFSVAGPEEKYKVKSLGSYSGTAGDSFRMVLNQYFSTLDADNDQLQNGNCAVLYQSGWWHKECHLSNLNGLYLPGPQQEYATMMCWKEFRGHYYGLKSSRMMIRAVDKTAVV
ncbi:AAEL007942-PA [Aedes aegypti]|uniref:AAEL007942-PA n=1 Tax=Aedes aegypti TaxID=7159 RepID=Q170E9_AEDAE|nr:AAEL007942-PA [Aedes aegypti]